MQKEAFWSRVPGLAGRLKGMFGAGGAKRQVIAPPRAANPIGQAPWYKQPMMPKTPLTQQAGDVYRRNPTAWKALMAGGVGASLMTPGQEPMPTDMVPDQAVAQTQSAIPAASQPAPAPAPAPAQAPAQAPGQPAASPFSFENFVRSGADVSKLSLADKEQLKDSFLSTLGNFEVADKLELTKIALEGMQQNPGLFTLILSYLWGNATPQTATSQPGGGFNFGQVKDRLRLGVDNAFDRIQRGLAERSAKRGNFAGISNFPGMNNSTGGVPGFIPTTGVSASPNTLMPMTSNLVSGNLSQLQYPTSPYLAPPQFNVGGGQLNNNQPMESQAPSPGPVVAGQAGPAPTPIARPGGPQLPAAPPQEPVQAPSLPSLELSRRLISQQPDLLEQASTAQPRAPTPVLLPPSAVPTVPTAPLSVADVPEMVRPGDLYYTDEMAAEEQLARQQAAERANALTRPGDIDARQVIADRAARADEMAARADAAERALQSGPTNPHTPSSPILSPLRNDAGFFRDSLIQQQAKQRAAAEASSKVYQDYKRDREAQFEEVFKQNPYADQIKQIAKDRVGLKSDVGMDAIQSTNADLTAKYTNYVRSRPYQNNLSYGQWLQKFQENPNDPGIRPDVAAILSQRNRRRKRLARRGRRKRAGFFDTELVAKTALLQAGKGGSNNFVDQAVWNWQPLGQLANRFGLSPGRISNWAYGKMTGGKNLPAFMGTDQMADRVLGSPNTPDAMAFNDMLNVGALPADVAGGVASFIPGVPMMAGMGYSMARAGAQPITSRIGNLYGSFARGVGLGNLAPSRFQPTLDAGYRGLVGDQSTGSSWWGNFGKGVRKTVVDSVLPATAWQVGGQAPDVSGYDWDTADRYMASLLNM